MPELTSNYTKYAWFEKESELEIELCANFVGYTI